MDAADKAILREAQSRLPIAPRPFRVLGERLGLAEEEVLDRLAALKARGVVRRIGGNFSSRALGFFSTLCAARVPPEKLEAFVAAVNAEPGVTHNYRRDHAYNVWFTFIAPSAGEVAARLAALEARTGVGGIRSFPARRLFKIQVDFPL